MVYLVRIISQGVVLDGENVELFWKGASLFLTVSGQTSCTLISIPLQCTAMVCFCLLAQFFGMKSITSVGHESTELQSYGGGCSIKYAQSKIGVHP